MFLYMFRASSSHLQEVNDVNCTCMQPLVFSFSAGGRLVHLIKWRRLHLASAQDGHLIKWRPLHLASAQEGHLQRMRIPEVAYMYN